MIMCTFRFITSSLIVVNVFLSLLHYSVNAVDRSKFRTCGDTGFCRRYRGKSGPAFEQPYNLDLDSVRAHDGRVTGKVNGGSHINSTPLNLNIEIYTSGSVRLKITEEEPRWQPLDLLMTDALKLGTCEVIKGGDAKFPSDVRTKPSSSYFGVTFGPSLLVVHVAPLRFDLYYNGILQITANERSLMHYEKRQIKARDLLNSINQEASDDDRHGGKEVVDYGEDGLAIYADGTKEEKRVIEGGDSDAHSWSESFGGHKDSMPNGPISVGMDFSFPFAQNVYGIPEHTSPLSLPTTITGSAGYSPHYNQPYRLYNLDVFEYELDQTMALYGHIPLLLAHGFLEGKASTAGIFWFNPSETFIDISDGGSNTSPYKQSHWISESGEIDVFLLPGPSPKEVFAQYTRLTGTQQLPPMFALGYHQCRWNYRDEKDVAAVEGMFEDLDYPMDVIWLDIEHTNGKRYFTWDDKVFPTPLEMQKNVSKHGRKMVTIVDPHIKTDSNYHIHKDATALGLYIKTQDGKDYDGWCWPGQSSYLDFTNPRVRDWWASQFALDKYVGSTLDLYTWNDMNEPSVFNGPEVSMQKENLNLDGIEHREWHNLYGLYMQKATAEGLVKRSPDPLRQQRHFVLSRAFWAGSQRYGAIWTGDNTAEWGHLKIASPMLLSINLAGLSFAGSDVGGFFGEPGAELFTRWYQAGAFNPFFRGHAHHDTKRREPWVFGEPYTTILRSVAMIRYSLLPLWYTTFYEAFTKGWPVMRTMFTEFPDDVNTFAMDDQWMVGGSLLVKPVTDAGKTSIDVYLPGPNMWYDFYSLQALAPSTLTSKSHVNAPLEKIPLFIRGGIILPRKMRLRRSSKLMYYDPYTLTVAPDNDGNAEGFLYMDDEYSLANEKLGEFALRKFTFTGSMLSCSSASWAATAPSTPFNPINTVERIEIAGYTKTPTRVSLRAQDQVEMDLVFFHDTAKNILTIKKPDVKVISDWVIVLL